MTILHYAFQIALAYAQHCSIWRHTPHPNCSSSSPEVFCLTDFLLKSLIGFQNNSFHTYQWDWASKAYPPLAQITFSYKLTTYFFYTFHNFTTWHKVVNSVKQTLWNNNWWGNEKDIQALFSREQESYEDWLEEDLFAQDFDATFIQQEAQTSREQEEETSNNFESQELPFEEEEEEEEPLTNTQAFEDVSYLSLQPEYRVDTRGKGIFFLK